MVLKHFLNYIHAFKGLFIKSSLVIRESDWLKSRFLFKLLIGNGHLLFPEKFTILILFCRYAIYILYVSVSSTQLSCAWQFKC